MDGQADLVVEIASSKSGLWDRLTKFNEYERSGVREYWLIDYEEKKAEFYVLNQEGKYEIVSMEHHVSIAQK